MIVLSSGSAAGEMPKYKSHKVVWALKISEVEKTETTNQGNFNCYLEFEDKRFAPLAVGQKYYEKHTPKAGGYYVVYDDGYASFSPAAAFESGYTPFVEPTPTALSKQADIDLQTAIGGKYDMLDGRSFWVDAATVREIMSRIAPVILAECERHRFAAARSKPQA